jgi:hypothetical protein
MMIYEIILEYECPVDIWDYRKAQRLTQQDAEHILMNFPFQEPVEYREEWGNEPEPQILFGNLISGLMMVIGYLGNKSYQLTITQNKDSQIVYKVENIKEVLDYLNFFFHDGSTFSLFNTKIKGKENFWYRAKFLVGTIFGL